MGFHLSPQRYSVVGPALAGVFAGGWWEHKTASSHLSMLSKRIMWCEITPLPPKMTDTFVESYSRLAREKMTEAAAQEQLENEIYGEMVDADLRWADYEPRASYMRIEQINANPELEDRAIVVPIHTTCNGRLLLAAVIDGHGGWQVAEYVQRRLNGFIEREINKASAVKGKLSAEEIGNAMIAAFNNLDDDIMRRIEGTCSIGLSRNAKIGACCAAVVVTPDHLITANTGDCRAVMCSNGSTKLLSAPHSANEPVEQERLKREHPGEIDAVVCKKSFAVNKIPSSILDYPYKWIGMLGTEIRETGCYVKGRLQPTRSFGDFYLKKKEFSYDFESQRPFVRNGLSFPYISVEPEIIITPRNKSKDQFLLLGSDGVWDFLTPDEGVKIVKDNMKFSIKEAAGGVIQTVLQKAAAEVGVSAVEITLLSPKQRRRIYDDTSVCVIKLDGFNLEQLTKS